MVNRVFRSILLAVAVLALIPSISLARQSESYPSKPIHIVVPASVGGTSDTIARIFADFLQRRMGQPVVVENKPGATGSIGTSLVSRAPADGYTLLFNGSEFSAMPAVRKNLNYNYQDFTYLVRCFSLHPLLLGSPKLPVKTALELVDHMKANPGKTTYGTTGIGGIIQLGIARFEGAAGVTGLHVPFMGISPVYAALLGGHLDFSQGLVPLPDGINVLASVGSKRNPAYPDVPTLDEVGITGATWDIWFGFLAPPNLPADIREKLSSDIVEVLKEPEALERFKAALGGIGPDILVGDDFKKATVQEHTAWKSLAEKNNIVIE